MIDRGPLAAKDLHATYDTGTPPYGHPLTARELEVLSMLAIGFTQLEAADHLGISNQTVKNHLTNARAKMGARTTTRAVVLYVRSMNYDGRKRSMDNRGLYGLKRPYTGRGPDGRFLSRARIEQAERDSPRSPVARADSRAVTPAPPGERRTA